MLKKNLLVIILIFPLFFACEKDPLAKAKKEAVQSSKDFFQWYKKNKKPLLEKRKAIVFIDEGGFYAVNMFKIDAYTKFLMDSDKFSKEFIQKEKDYWLNECLDIIFQMQENGKKGENTIFPCKFKENPFYIANENLTSEYIENLSIIPDSISLEKALLKYNDHNLKLIQVEGTWKIEDWINK